MVLLLLVLLVVYVGGYGAGRGSGRRRGWREGWSAGYALGVELSERQLAAARTLGWLEGRDPEGPLRELRLFSLRAASGVLLHPELEELPELPTLAGDGDVGR
jgi:hypothetical protein